MQIKNDDKKMSKVLVSRAPCGECNHKHYILKRKGSARLKDLGCVGQFCSCGKEKHD